MHPDDMQHTNNIWHTHAHIPMNLNANVAKHVNEHKQEGLQCVHVLHHIYTQTSLAPNRTFAGRRHSAFLTHNIIEHPGAL